MNSQLCKQCQETWFIDTLPDDDIPHHQSRESILAAVDNGCSLCSRIVKSREFAELDSSTSLTTDCTIWKHSSDGMNSVRLEIEVCPSSDSGDYEVVSETGPVRISYEDDEVSIPEDGRNLDFEPNDDIEYSNLIWSFIFIPKTDIPPHYIQYESPQQDRGADDIWFLARSWLDECCQGHKKCSAPQSLNFYPTRLVEILDSATVRVIECRNIKSLQRRYAAFSHCWGKAETLKLNKDNKPRLKTSIDISELPQSYKEAVDACIHLDIRYIWIDSLCIIQDSADDWRAESATMMYVYGNALLTIAAAAAAESSESSLIHRDSLNIQPTTIMVPQEEMPHIPYILAPKQPFKEIRGSPLRRRAWVLQESHISNRILSLADTQLWWECREVLRCESWPAGIPAAVLDNTTRLEESKEGDDMKSAHSRWHDLVKEYTRRRLTIFSDKLIAMAGLASHLQPSIGKDDKYVAGFWRSQLPHALCWGDSGLAKEGFRPSQYRAPSWSWASLEGVQAHQLYNADHSVTDACQVLDIRLITAGTNPYGDLKGGYMLLLGRLFPVKTKESSINNSFPKLPILEFPDFALSPHNMNAQWDEGAHEEALISHLDTSGINHLEFASLISAKRITKVEGRWEGDLFYFPVSEFSGDTEPRTCGLILGRAKGEPADRFQRLGWSSCKGEGPCSYFRKGESRRFFIV